MILTRTSPLPYFAKLIVSRIDFVCVFHSHQLISVWKLLCAGVRLPVFRIGCARRIRAWGRTRQHKTAKAMLVYTLVLYVSTWTVDGGRGGAQWSVLTQLNRSRGWRRPLETAQPHIINARMTCRRCFVGRGLGSRKQS